jgi:hypothetical protein
MMIGWFNTKEAVEFGKSLASYYDEKHRTNDNKTGKKAAEKQYKLGADLMKQLLDFKDHYRPNFFQKAKLGNAFKWRLLDLGYDNQTADQLTRDILLILR